MIIGIDHDDRGRFRIDVNVSVDFDAENEDGLISIIYCSSFLCNMQCVYDAHCPAREEARQDDENETR